MRIFEYEHRGACSAVYVDGRMIVGSFDEPTELALPFAPPRDGTPVILDDEGHEDEGVRAFVTYLTSAEGGVVGSTALAYAKDIAVYARFLLVRRSKTIWTATGEDLGEYRRYRLEGPPQARLERSSWVRFLAALQRLLDWGGETGRLQVTPRVKGRRDRITRGTKVRMIPMSDYIVLRDVGLLGLGAANAPDPGFKGRHSLRNAAYAELGVCTGLRRAEANSLLTGELPDPDDGLFAAEPAPGRQVQSSARSRQAMVDLAPPITKGGVGRRIAFPRRVALHYIQPYLREERPLLLERWRHGGGAADLGAAMILAYRDGRDTVRIFEGPRHRDAGRRVKTSTLTVEERQRLVFLPSVDAPLAAAEPAALFLGEDGRPMQPGAWNLVIGRAAERCRKRCDFRSDPTPHSFRHTFAVYMLSALIKQQVGELSELGRMRDRAANDHNMADAYRRVVGDPLRRLQLLLGHASQTTTQLYLDYVADAHRIIEESIALFDEALVRGAEGLG